MRKLCTIRAIDAIDPIQGADAIERATIDGWHVVVKKGELSPGDKVVYCEIDSVFPERPEFEFLRDKKFRIKTVKLRGQISQGICFPLSILPEGNYQEGDEVTDLLGVIKYDPQEVAARLGGQPKGSFPSWLIKTDEERVQNIKKILPSIENTDCFITEKLDGTSFTAYLKDGEFGVCSRNIDKKETPTDVYWQYARKINLEEKLRSYNCNVAIQGELIGPGIQKNHYKLSEIKLYAFNLFWIDHFAFASYEVFTSAMKELTMDIVPLVIDTWPLLPDVDAILAGAEGKSLINPDVEREGVVIRSIVETDVWGLGRLSFKAINNKFLLKGK